MKWTCQKQKKSTLKNYILSKNCTNITLEEIENEDILHDVMSIVECHIKNINSRGKTATLWVQYFFLVHLLRRFIYAERSRNWYAHLECIEKMIPFFSFIWAFPICKICSFISPRYVRIEKKYEARRV